MEKLTIQHRGFDMDFHDVSTLQGVFRALASNDEEHLLLMLEDEEGAGWVAEWALDLLTDPSVSMLLAKAIIREEVERYLPADSRRLVNPWLP